MSCVYKTDKDECMLFGQQPALCTDCVSSLEEGDPAFSSKWIDPLVVTDCRRKRVDSLRGMLAGGSAFLVCGGPSANDLPLELLSRRGIWSLAVNNAAGHPRIRPQAFVCSDPPSKFSHSVWLDPGVMKFVPTAKMAGRRARLRKKIDGEFSPLDRDVAQCPNVWSFKRWSHMWPDTRFFLTDGACWGNHQSGTDVTGKPKTVCTMLIGLRLLYYLGARRIYLVGVDFVMRPDYGYSFAQSRDEGASSSNNRQFAVVNDLLCEMRDNGTFGKMGLKVFNCFRESGLRAFPFAPFEDVVKEAQGIVECQPDLSDWYRK